MAASQFPSDFLQLLPYILQYLYRPDPRLDGTPVLLHLPCRSFQGQAAVPHKKMYLPECIQVLGLVKAVSLRISDRPYKRRKTIGPETHQRHIFTEGVRHFTYCIIKLFHTGINP